MAWSLANPFGIQVDDEVREGLRDPAWHAGHINDILSLSPGVILVAAETGGVWHIDGSYNATPLSHDWSHPDVECLAFGPLGSRHVMAGCIGGLYEANTASAHSFRAWTPVNLPAPVTTVYRIVATESPPRIAIATNAGVWWAPGRPLLASGDPAGRYDWREARNLSRDEFFGLALSDDGIIAGVKNSEGASTLRGIFYGSWSSGLTMSPAAMNMTIKDKRVLRAISIASCRDKRRRAYAIGVGSRGSLVRILRSEDGGRTWRTCPKTLEGNHAPGWDVTRFCGDSENGGWHKTIAVHHQNPDVVAFGGLRTVLSANGGQTWRGLGGSFTTPDRWDYDNRHQHDDVHAVYFEPGFSEKRLYIASDGGIVQTEDWSAQPTKFKSAMNRNMANLQFYSAMEVRQFWGTLAICSRKPVIGGGLQDNGNVWCQLKPQSQYWRKIDGGDGGWVAFIVNGVPPIAFLADYEELVSNTMGQAVGHAVWRAAGFSRAGTVPLEPPLTGRGSGFDKKGLKGPVAEAVPQPRWKPLPDLLMHAVGAGKILAADLLRSPGDLDGKDIENTVVFGLFGNNQDQTLYWSEIGRLPAKAQRISALGTDTGYSVYAGTIDGRIFLIDAPSGQVTEMAVEPLAAGPGAIVRIVAQGGRGPFAVMRTEFRSHVLELAGGWREIASSRPPPAEVYYGFDIYRGGGPVTMALATDTDVWVSPDDGLTWFRSISGLPRVPHCSDLRFGKLDGADMLFLGTYGWSVWMIGVEDLWETRMRPITGSRHRKFGPEPTPPEPRRSRRTAAVRSRRKARGKKKKAKSKRR